jgi:hypothetical protein
VWDVDGNKYFDFLSGKQFGFLLCVTRAIGVSWDYSASLHLLTLLVEQTRSLLCRKPGPLPP